MSSFWPSEDGWPYPDSGAELIDLSAESDDDLLSLTVPAPHLFDDLDPLERLIITEHYGLGGVRARSMGELHGELGLPTSDIRTALGSGLDKLRAQLRT